MALAEKIRRVLADEAGHVDSQREKGRVIHTVSIGKQVFVITCEEATPDKIEPPV